MSAKIMLWLFGLMILTNLSFFLPVCSANNENVGVTQKFLLDKEHRVTAVSGVFDMSWKNKTHFMPDTKDRKLLVEALTPVIKNIESPKDADIAKVSSLVKKMNLDFKEYNGAEGHWLILGAAPKYAGCGYYVFRVGKVEKEIVVQAPHAIYDYGTDTLAKTAFTKMSVRAVFFSDWQRYGSKGAEPDKKSRFDMAHNPNTLFQDLTGLFATISEVKFVQFHGFAQTTIGGAKVHFVLSSGSRKNSSLFVDRLESELIGGYSKDIVKVFPKNSRLLGGTTNVQGKMLRKTEIPFVHVEISEFMRQVFENSEKDALKFIRMVMAAFR